MRQCTACHSRWRSTLQLVRHYASAGTVIANYICGSTRCTICVGTAHFNWYGTSLRLAQQSHMATQDTYGIAHSTQFALAQLSASAGTAVACGKTSHICDNTQHTICIGTAHFNWYGTALQQAQQLRMAKQATYATAHSTPFALAQHSASAGTAVACGKTSHICDNTQHTICIGTAHFNWYGTARQQAQQLRMAKQATYATAHSTPFALAQHTSTSMALHFNWHSNCIWLNKLHNYVTAQPHHYIKNGASILRMAGQAACIHVAARQLRVAERATLAAAHGTPFALAQRVFGWCGAALRTGATYIHNMAQHTEQRLHLRGAALQVGR